MVRVPGDGWQASQAGWGNERNRASQLPAIPRAATSTQHHGDHREQAVRDDGRDWQVPLGWFRLPGPELAWVLDRGAPVVIARPQRTGIHRASMMKPSSATGISSTNATQASQTCPVSG